MAKNRADGCKHARMMYTTNEENRPSARGVLCCNLKHGFMLKHWKCSGRQNEDCPLNRKDK